MGSSLGFSGNWKDAKRIAAHYDSVDKPEKSEKGKGKGKKSKKDKGKK